MLDRFPVELCSSFRFSSIQLAAATITYLVILIQFELSNKDHAFMGMGNKTHRSMELMQ